MSPAVNFVPLSSPWSRRKNVHVCYISLFFLLYNWPPSDTQKVDLCIFIIRLFLVVFFFQENPLFSSSGRRNKPQSRKTVDQIFFVRGPTYFRPSIQRQSASAPIIRFCFMHCSSLDVTVDWLLLLHYFNHNLCRCGQSTVWA